MDDGSVILKTRVTAAPVALLAPPAPERKPWKRQRLAAVLSPIILIVGWTLLSRSGWFPAEIVVPPEVLWTTFVTYWSNGQLPDHLTGSLGRLFGGYLIGAGIGIALGTLMGVSKQAEAYVLPGFHILRQLPTVALIPAFIMIFGVGETVKLVLVAKATALPVALAAFQGVKGIPRTWLDVARIHRIPALTQFTHVIVPASLPVLVQGLRTALARSWMVLVAAELLVADSGIGQMMEWGRQTFRLDLVLIGVVITGLIGFTLDKGFRALERVLTRGSRKQNA
ncbi:ABC transporter permease [Asticcacaulis sp. YBE204]|uniref:ABC transporter permease n=1 Tax=Asticcacaulis sp. YBE204 TaxID=1282363 RepID=UPI0003C404DF|nr:ABC transporter permease [Asticcacaulis sp. YBE204]ESQ80384.1 hypothetical protein AEYBE204_03725 [Asticcacaulis sp. YBE204]